MSERHWRAAFAEWWWRLRCALRRHVVTSTIVVLLLLFLVVYFAKSMFVVIPAGRVGVLWELFGGGTVLNRTLGEGLHVIMPWNKIYIYDLRVQLRHQNLDVLSVDGLEMKIDVAYRFELIRGSVPILHQFVGPDYIQKLIDPDIAANARDVFSANTPQEIYSDRRKQIQEQIIAAVNQHLRDSFNPDPAKQIDYVRIEDVLTRSITLPPSVEAAINSKNEQQQLNEEYDYRILREAKEAERKRIEALGIQQFQTIISHGITDSYLRWRGIEATLQLAQSPNSKVVIIGGGRSGLPIILGDSDSTHDTSSNVAVTPPQQGPSSPLESLERQLEAAAPRPFSPSPAPVTTPVSDGRAVSTK